MCCIPPTGSRSPGRCVGVASRAAASDTSDRSQSTPGAITRGESMHGPTIRGESTPGATTPGPITRSLYLRPWRLDLTDRSGRPQLLTRAAIARDLARALVAGGAPQPAAVGIILTDDAELAELNERAMGRSGTTDVLSFPLLPPSSFPPHRGREPEAGITTEPRAAMEQAFVLPPGQRVHLGEVVVSVERAVEQAEEGRGGQTGDVSWSPASELRLLVIHGTLHLCGWDHAEPEEEAAMRALERELLRH